MLRRHVDEVSRCLRDVLEAGADGRERRPQVAEDLPGLRLEISVANDVAVAVERHLAGEQDDRSPRPYDVGVARRSGQSFCLDVLKRHGRLLIARLVGRATD